MPFTCAICSLDIVVGEELLSDEKMNVAHKRCVLQLEKDPSHPSVSIPTVFLVPPPPPPPAPPSPPSPLKPVTFKSVVEAGLTGHPICPRCGGRLGPVLKGSYNHYPDNRFCDRCVRFIPEPPGSSSPPCDSSTWKPSPPIMKPSTPIYDTIEIKNTSSRRNGKHVTPKKKRKGRR